MSIATDRPQRGSFDVRREERWRMWALFGVLLALAFVGLYVLAWIVSLVASIWSDPGSNTLRWVATWPGALELFAIAVGVAVLYWYASRRSARNRLVAALHAQPLDPSDKYHQRLANIVEEMRVASGAPPIECLVVPTIDMNAFAFSNFDKGACIGVTEGTLSRLSRAQLEGVVAHEVAHILSGSYVTVTVSSLLFGIYSSWGEGLDKAIGSGEEGASSSGNSGAGAGIGLFIFVAVVMRIVVAVLQVASTIISAAISRTREQEADLAAARYTRDPVGLAEALRTISRHPGGGGFIPEGLAALCIRPSASDGTSWLDRLFATHPPTSERIDSLLSLANISRGKFVWQAAEGDKAFRSREHVATAPGARPQADPALAALGGAPAAVAAAASPAVAAILAAGIAGTPGTTPSAAPGAHAGAGRCPVCGEVLQTVCYEGANILACRSCGGRLVGKEEMGRIIARREMGFTDEQQRLAKQIDEQGNQLRRAAFANRPAFQADPVACPLCAETMVRRHYNYAYAVAVDSCERCNVTWFDKDELEVLQILIERTTG
jgi:Zn-dependent protease with chaperone function/Zn-finger nucleic acid-binding protein